MTKAGLPWLEVYTKIVHHEHIFMIYWVTIQIDNNEHIGMMYR